MELDWYQDLILDMVLNINMEWNSWIYLLFALINVQVTIAGKIDRFIYVFVMYFFLSLTFAR